MRLGCAFLLAGVVACGGNSAELPSEVERLRARVEALTTRIAAVEAVPGQPGARGADGERGLRGETGAVGPEGAMGPPGPGGLRGEDGERGASGEQGAKGDPGSVGAQGPAGRPGEMGPAGAVGPTGVMGPMGPTGPAGARGEVGPAGVAGEAGARGDVGPAGPEGDMGPMGLVGQTGPAGATGPAGERGPAGENGAPGAPGQDGAPGVPGQDGAPGVPGAAGATGAMGPAGPAGPAAAEVLEITMSEAERTTFLIVPGVVGTALDQVFPTGFIVERYSPLLTQDGALAPILLVDVRYDSRAMPLLEAFLGDLSLGSVALHSRHSFTSPQVGRTLELEDVHVVGFALDSAHLVLALRFTRVVERYVDPDGVAASPREHVADPSLAVSYDLTLESGPTSGLVFLRTSTPGAVVTPVQFAGWSQGAEARLIGERTSGGVGFRVRTDKVYDAASAALNAAAAAGTSVAFELDVALTQSANPLVYIEMAVSSARPSTRSFGPGLDDNVDLVLDDIDLTLRRFTPQGIEIESTNLQWP